MNTSTKRTEIRIFAKILHSKKQSRALAKVVYFRNEMTVEFFNRWRWFFEYRAALIRVQNPKAYTSFEYGPYDYQLPEDVYKAKVKNQYFSDKRQLTKFKSKLTEIQQNWNELFPLEEHPDYIRVQKKLEYLQRNLEISRREYDQVFSKTEHVN